MEPNIFEFETPEGAVFEVYHGDDGEIGFFVARPNECVSFYMPADEAWNLIGNLTEALT